MSQTIKSIVWICTLAVVLLSCNGQSQKAQSEQTADGLFSATQTAPRSDQRSERAKVVRLYEIPAPLNDRPEKILHRRGYTTSYNHSTKTPNWVAWHLTDSHTRGSVQRHDEVFSEDEDIVKNQRATDDDYYNSRYDRGHMCPAGDNKWDSQAMTQSFLFTNICPQNHGLNKYEWNDLEMLCRDWAREYGAIDVVCGPVYSSSGEQKTIGKNRVWVPDAFFKVVLCRGRQPKAIGFIYENRGGQQRMSDCMCSVDDIERITGIDFYPLLADDVENRIEARASLREW